MHFGKFQGGDANPNARGAITLNIGKPIAKGGRGTKTPPGPSEINPACTCTCTCLGISSTYCHFFVADGTCMALKSNEYQPECIYRCAT